MNFTKEKVKDFYLLSTEVENIFINEYMPSAPGEYVKVFLYGLLYSQNQADMTMQQFARQLQLTEKQVEDAWIISKDLDIPVICFGLKTNFKSEFFEGSKRLFDESFNIVEKNAANAFKTLCFRGTESLILSKNSCSKYTSNSANPSSLKTMFLAQ